MKKIPLTQNKFALVDDEDYEWLMQWKWFAMKKKRKSSIIFYAARKSTKILNGKKTRCMRWMHREINKTKKGFLTDHRDNNGLNNQRNNLRDATQSQNSMNVQNIYGVSKYKGVSWCKNQKKWRASIRKNGKATYLGRSISEKKASDAYEKKAKIEFGEFYYNNGE